MIPNVVIRNNAPNIGIRNSFPIVRASSFQTGILATTSGTLKRGMPWGILMAITRNADVNVSSVAYFGDMRPNTRIINA